MIGLLVLFVALNMLSLRHWPKPWTDEVCATECAANLYLKGELRSTADPLGTTADLSFLNIGHHLALYGWYAVFGFGLLQTRCFDIAVMVLLALASWHAAVRLRIASGIGARIMLIALLLFSDEFVRVYRGHRYDILNILWIVLACLAATVPRGLYRRASLIVLGAFMSWTSLGPLPYALGLMAALWAATRRVRVGDVAALTVGLVVGLLAYVTFLAWSKGLALFVGFVGLPSHLGGSLGDRFIGAMRGVLLSRSSLLLVATALFAWGAVGEKRGCIARPVTGILAATVVVPLVMSGIGRYSYFYAWMPLLPTAFLVAYLDGQFRIDKRMRALLRTAVLCVCLMGLPYREAMAGLERQERSIDALDAFLALRVRPDDVVVCDDAPYYSVKSRARDMYMTGKRKGMTRDEKDRVTVVVLSMDEERWRTAEWFRIFFEDFGGVWVLEARYTAPRGKLRMLLPVPPAESVLYDVVVYRRLGVPDDMRP